MRRTTWLIGAALALLALASCGGSSASTAPVKVSGRFLSNGLYVVPMGPSNLSAYVGSWDNASGTFAVMVDVKITGGKPPYSYDVSNPSLGFARHFTSSSFLLPIRVRPSETPAVEVSGSDSLGTKFKQSVQSSEQAPGRPSNYAPPVVTVSAGTGRFSGKPCDVDLTASGIGLSPATTEATWVVGNKTVRANRLKLSGVAPVTSATVYVLDTNRANLGRPIGTLTLRIC